MLMTPPMKAALFVATVMTVASVTLADDTHTFQRIQLSDQFWSEGANFGETSTA
jgi:hypothetical protein